MTDTGVHAVFFFVREFGIWYGTVRLRLYQDVFVTDCKNIRIQILDDYLHFQRFITHHTMEYPLDVKLTPDEVYILCEDSPCILVFSHAGEKIRSLFTWGTEMQIGEAYFFCLDRTQNLLFSDWENNQVRIFSIVSLKLEL